MHLFRTQTLCWKMQSQTTLQFAIALLWEIYCTYKKRNPNWHQYKTGIHVANFKMIYHSENEEDSCHYKLSDRDNCKVSFAGRHFTGFFGRLKQRFIRLMMSMGSAGPYRLFAWLCNKGGVGEREIMDVLTCAVTVFLRAGNPCKTPRFIR